MPNVSNLVKTIQDIMRKDAGTYGDAQRLEQLGWMFFLKIFDDRHKFGDIYEKLLKDLQSAGNAGEFYTPHATDDGPGDVDHLLPAYEKLLAQIAATREKLKAQLMEALSR